jgi:hypothetical protein
MKRRDFWDMNFAICYCEILSVMVISIETAMAHPKRGFIKLEDTVAVAEAGCEGFGDKGRGWNRARRP